jgi:RNA polymerase sigma factor (sigma-70 family)
LVVLPPLTREEEAETWGVIFSGRAAAQRLASTKRLSVNTQQQLRAVRAKGRKGEERLISATLGLVRKRIRDLGFSVEADELEGAALEGLVEAMRRFDTSRGVRFSTYANSWITKMIHETLHRRYPLPPEDLRLVVAYRRLVQKGNGQRPRLVDVATTLGITRGEASRIVALSANLSSGPVSLDAGDETVRHLAMEEHHVVDAEWIIDALREILGDDFRDFWMVVGQVYSLEELAAERGISKQAMWKRKQRWLEKVRQSDDAEHLLRWLSAQ